MRRTALIPLAGLDDQCAVHQFIRVHGRPPTPEELARCQQLSAPAARSSIRARSAGWSGAAGLARREVARLIARL